jgi:hypothetical protein
VVSVSVVNGYLCYSSCDVAKARSGKDPHPKPDESGQADGAQGADPSPAVVFGGALAGRNAATPADPATADPAVVPDPATQNPPPASVVDILA